jgi:hypothetical protein
LGLMVAGPIADKFGIQTWFLVGGVVTLFMAISSFFIPAVMNFEKGRNGKGPLEIAPEEIVISAAD